MTPKKLIPIILIFLLAGCASIHDIEKKKADGDFILETYNYPLDKTYDAVKFVIRHSENFWVRKFFESSVLEDMKEDKTILLRSTVMSSIDIGIYFENTDDNRTKVYFIKGSFTGSAWRETRILKIIEETGYYLTHGETKYRKYTHEAEQKRIQSHLPPPDLTGKEGV